MSETQQDIIDDATQDAIGVLDSILDTLNAGQGIGWQPGCRMHAKIRDILARIRLPTSEA